MRVVVFGASGGIGSAVVAAARAAGHEVVAVVRDGARIADHAAHGVAVVEADLTDRAALERALANADAAISALGPTANTQSDEAAYGTTIGTVIEAVTVSHVRRFVALSGAAVDVPGERKALPDRLASWFVRRAVPHVVGAKQRELEMLLDSGATFVAPRPPRVVPGPPTGGYRIGLDLRLGPRDRIAQGDLAVALVDQLTDERFVGRAPFVTG